MAAAQLEPLRAALDAHRLALAIVTADSGDGAGVDQRGAVDLTGSRRAARGPNSRQLVADQCQKDDRAPGERRMGGDLTRAEPGPERAEQDLEQSEQRDFRR